MNRTDLTAALEAFRRVQLEPDTLGSSQLVGLLRAFCFFTGMAGICAVLGAAAAGLPFTTSSDGNQSSHGSTIERSVLPSSFSGLVGADERLFNRRASR